VPPHGADGGQGPAGARRAEYGQCLGGDLDVKMGVPFPRGQVQAQRDRGFLMDRVQIARTSRPRQRQSDEGCAPGRDDGPQVDAVRRQAHDLWRLQDHHRRLTVRAESRGRLTHLVAHGVRRPRNPVQAGMRGTRPDIQWHCLSCASNVLVGDGGPRRKRITFSVPTAGSGIIPPPLQGSPAEPGCRTTECPRSASSWRSPRPSPFRTGSYTTRRVRPGWR
jgi:hypothetical protein